MFQFCSIACKRLPNALAIKLHLTRYIYIQLLNETVTNVSKHCHLQMFIRIRSLALSKFSPRCRRWPVQIRHRLRTPNTHQSLKCSWLSKLFQVEDFFDSSLSGYRNIENYKF